MLASLTTKRKSKNMTTKPEKSPSTEYDFRRGTLTRRVALTTSTVAKTKNEQERDEIVRSVQSDPEMICNGDFGIRVNRFTFEQNRIYISEQDNTWNDVVKEFYRMTYQRLRQFHDTKENIYPFRMRLRFVGKDCSHEITYEPGESVLNEEDFRRKLNKGTDLIRKQLRREHNCTVDMDDDCDCEVEGVRFKLLVDEILYDKRDVAFMS